MTYEQALALTNALRNLCHSRGVKVRMALATADGAYKVCLAIMGEEIASITEPMDPQDAAAAYGVGGAMVFA